MIRVICVLCLCGWMLTSCSNSESKDSSDDKISGIYVREYSKEILHQLSGNKVGMSTFRDSIKITESSDGYHVVNTKWKMNDYDQDGWQDMKHGESRPLPEFDATYDAQAKTLNPKTSGIAPALYIDKDRLSVGPKSKIAYTKVD
jgi:hypothetical protein